MYEVRLDKKARKQLENLNYGNPKIATKIKKFVEEELPKVPNPKALPNAKKIQNFTNRYRWRIGDYRIIGEFFEGVFKIITIIKISQRQEAYQS